MTRHHVVSVLVDGMSALEAAVANDFLGADRRDLTPDWYRFSIVSDTPGLLSLDGGMQVWIEHGLDRLRRADTILIPGWCGCGNPPSEALVAELQRAHRRGARFVSFCTGAFALARAGLLDGLTATTHWSRTDELRDWFPRVEVDPSVLYVDEGQVLTSAGAAASIDLALHLIRKDFGAEIANAVARDMVVAPHREGGQAQFIESPVPVCAETDTLAATLDWAAANLDCELSVSELAAHAAMSPRTFTRRFRSATGTSPHQWLIAQRVARAQLLLETSDDSIERIADAVGFGTAASLRLHFQRQLYTTPQAYRRRFDQICLAERSATVA